MRKQKRRSQTSTAARLSEPGDRSLRQALKPESLSLYFNNHFNLDACAEWDLRNTKSGSRVLAPFTENISDQFRCAIRHDMLFGEVERRIDEAHQLDDPRHAVQIADM